MDLRNSVKVEILDDEYTIRSQTSAEETRRVAAYVDAEIRAVMKAGVVETHKAAILACLRVAGELFQARAGTQSVTDAMTALADEIRPWLPPAKRHD